MSAFDPKQKLRFGTLNIPPMTVSEIPNVRMSFFGTPNFCTDVII